MRYNIDFIQEENGKISVQGWAFNEKGYPVSVGLNTKFTIKRIKRYDVKAVFTDIEIDENCGFEIKYKKTLWNKWKELFLTFQSNDENIKISLAEKESVPEEENSNISLNYYPKISIVIPVYNTPKKYFKELISSVKNQTYQNWELCLADGGSSDDFRMYLKTFEDEKTKIVYLKENQGIAGNTNEAINISTGDYIAFCDHDDTLSKNALYEVALTINNHQRCDFIYSDEDKLSMDSKKYFQPNKKSDFNLKLLEVGNYLNHLSVIRKEFLDKIGLLNPEYDGSQDYDLVLRVAENTDKIYHVNKILYHWRSHSDSVAENPESKMYAFDNAIKALKAHFDRTGENVEIVMSDVYGSYQIKR